MCGLSRNLAIDSTQFLALLSTPAFPDTSENIFEGNLRMRTNLTDDHKIITLWPAESISRGDRSRLPFRRIWQSTQPNFSPCSQPQHFRTLQRIFSRETSGCGLILLTITKSSHSGPQSRSLAGT